MGKPETISIILNAHLPFVRHGSPPPVQPFQAGLSQPQAAVLPQPEALSPVDAPFHPDMAFQPEAPFQPEPDDGEIKFSAEEQWLFEAISDTYIPILEVFERLERDHVPFRLGISFSPLLCYMLQDEYLLRRYLGYVDRQIEFGAREMDRTENEPALHTLVQFYYDRLVDKRILFTERYGGNILKVFSYYQKKGRVEILTTAAAHAFLPIYTAYPEAIQAQIEAALSSFRHNFGKLPHGFWLPELGWSPDLDSYLRAYNFSYTIADTHAGLLKNPETSRGSFYPVRTPAQTLVLFRDFRAVRDVLDTETGCRYSPVYRDSGADAGFELPAEMVTPFLNDHSGRVRTGYAYSTNGGRGQNKQVYDPAPAATLAGEQALSFLEVRLSTLRKAREMGKADPSPGAIDPISVCAWDADVFGRRWYEGPLFLEALFRGAAGRQDVRFMNPGEYLCKQDRLSITSEMPEFSSWGFNGYAEPWLNASNDWMYPHVMQALERMIELAERFPNDTGLRERALNQAAREILLVQASDWPRMLDNQEHAEYARNQVEAALRNFTTIYEALGSNYISTEWLTNVERRHNFFPAINYRVFRRKQ
jgi:1,4-alpha-glucan branching enzyme